ncbi:hypothetical protein ACO0QE_002452 [Hanseniaspora vineae]
MSFPGEESSILPQESQQTEHLQPDANPKSATSALDLLNHYIESTEQRKVDLGVNYQHDTSPEQLHKENTLLKAQVNKLKSELLKYVSLNELKNMMEEVSESIEEANSERDIKSKPSTQSVLSSNASPSSTVAPPRSLNRNHKAKNLPLDFPDTDDGSISSSIGLSPDKSVIPGFARDPELQPALSPLGATMQIPPPPPSLNFVRKSDSNTSLHREAQEDNQSSKPAVSAVYKSSRIHISSSPKPPQPIVQQEITAPATSSNKDVLQSSSTPTRMKIVEDFSNLMVPHSESSSQYNAPSNHSTVRPQTFLSPGESPNRSNRLTAVVGDLLHSPLRPPVSVAGIREELEENEHANLMENSIPNLSHDLNDQSNVSFDKNSIISFDSSTANQASKPVGHHFSKDSLLRSPQISRDRTLSKDDTALNQTRLMDQALSSVGMRQTSAGSSALNTPKKGKPSSSFVSNSNQFKEDTLLASPILINKQHQSAPSRTVQRSTSTLAEKRSLGQDQSGSRPVVRQLLSGKTTSSTTSFGANNVCTSDSLSISSYSPNPQEFNAKFTNGPMPPVPQAVSQSQNQVPISNFSPSSNYSSHSSRLMSPRGKPVTSSIPLFIQPEDLNTVKIQVVGTLYHDLKINNALYTSNDAASISSRASNDENYSSRVLFAVLDRQTSKKIFEFCKTAEQIYELNQTLGSYMNLLSLPPLPEKTLFKTNIPARVNMRKEKLTDYFLSLFNIPVIPSMGLLKLAEFISTNTVTSGMGLVADNGLLEAWVLVRRPKTIGSSGGWKIKYAVVTHNGSCIHLYNMDSELTEEIRLPQSTIEIHPNIPEDKYGTYNGFLVHEPKKSGLSSSNKYYICLESAKEREQWIGLLSRLTVVPAGPKSGLQRKPISQRPSSNNGSSHPMSENTEDVFSAGKADIGHEANRDDFSTTGEFSMISDDHSSNRSTLLDTSVNSETKSLGNHSVLSGNMQNGGSGNTMSDRETKRNRMRSFFPFTKKNSHPNPEGMPASPKLTNQSTMETQIDSFMDSPSAEPLEHSNTISKTLEMMNLTTEVNNGKVFGNSLSAALDLSSQIYQETHKIPSVVYRCLEFLYKNHAMEEEGIFRLSGSSAVIKNLQEQFDKTPDIPLCSYTELHVDVNVVTGLLKLYLRSLPHFIFGDENFDRFKQILEENSKDDHAIAMKYKQLCQEHLSKENFDLMFVIFELLVTISRNSDVNKMTLRNLCIVFSPTLNIGVNMLQPFIADFGCIFKNKEPLDASQRSALNISIPTVG